MWREGSIQNERGRVCGRKKAGIMAGRLVKWCLWPDYVLRSYRVRMDYMELVPTYDTNGHAL